MNTLSIAILTTFVLAACASGGAEPDPTPRSGNTLQPSQPAPSGLIALRPRFRYTGDLEFIGGVAFLANAQGGMVVAVTAAHLVGSKAEWREGKVAVESVDFLNAKSRETVATAAAMSFYGSRESGLDLSENFTVFIVGQPPAGATVLEVANRAPAIGEEVVVYVCGQEGDSPQSELAGTIALADAKRMEVELGAESNPRAISGGPIVSRRDGKVIGVAQSSASREGKPLVLAGPVMTLRTQLDSLPDRPAKVTGWRTPRTP